MRQLFVVLAEATQFQFLKPIPNHPKPQTFRKKVFLQSNKTNNLECNVGNRHPPLTGPGFPILLKRTTFIHECV
jgi:hypothetical protein